MHQQLMYTLDSACAKLEGRALVILLPTRLNQFRKASSVIERLIWSYAGFSGL
jgi:hypothetical protein